MAYIGVAYIAMAYILMAYIAMVYILMAYILMAYILMASVIFESGPPAGSGSAAMMSKRDTRCSQLEKRAALSPWLSSGIPPREGQPKCLRAVARAFGVTRESVR